MFFVQVAEIQQKNRELEHNVHDLMKEVQHRKVNMTT